LLLLLLIDELWRCIELLHGSIQWRQLLRWIVEVLLDCRWTWWNHLALRTLRNLLEAWWEVLRRWLTWESERLLLLLSVSVIIERFLVLIEVGSNWRPLWLWWSQDGLLIQWRLVELLMAQRLLLLQELRLTWIVMMMNWNWKWLRWSQGLMMLLWRRMLIIRITQVWMERLGRFLVRQ